MEKARKDDPDRVKLIEELLKDEAKPIPKPPEPPKKSPEPTPKPPEPGVRRQPTSGSWPQRLGC